MNNTDSNRIPPHSPEIEQAALGCVVMTAAHDGGEAAKMLDVLRPSLFFDERNKTILMALRCLAIDKQPLDTVTVNQWLREKTELENAGGIAYLVGLPNNALPSAFESYVETLRDKSKRRELINLAAKADLLARDEAKEPAVLLRQFSDMASIVVSGGREKKEWLRFRKPSECRNYVVPDGHFLVGDGHIVRGEVTIIGGAPGVGKSRAGNALALAGANGGDWFGLTVNCQFKTIILQDENGMHRLHKDFAEIQDDGLDEFIRVSEPPPFGMAFDQPEFRAELARMLDGFKPDVVLLDPWNSVARDDKQRDYMEAFKAIRGTFPKGDAAPAFVVIAHTRKPHPDERASGRALLHMLAGSYALGSVARSAFVMQAGSDDPEDNRIVMTCCKNNYGSFGPPTAWRRQNSSFLPCPDFDWKAFDARQKESSSKITAKTLEALFENGVRAIAPTIAVAELMESANCKRTTAYDALSLDGPFGAHLTKSSDLLSWKS
jgi:hypothetical protein